MVLALIAMHWTLQGMVWLVGFLLELILAIAIFRFRLHKEFPLFSCYLVLELVRSIMLAAIGPHHPPYFYAYWITECFVSIFGFFVVEEVFRKAFERRLGLQKLGTVLFRYSLLALVVASVAVAAMAPRADGQAEGWVVDGWAWSSVFSFVSSCSGCPGETTSSASRLALQFTGQSN